MLLWKRISVVVTSGLLAACGGGSGGSEPSSSPSNFPNTAPQITGAPPAIAQVDLAYQFTPSATDADGDTLTFRIENRPDWATFSPSTGRLEGTPPSTAKPVYERVLISVTDGKAFSELPAFDLNVQGVAPANTAPAISGTPSSTVAMGNAYEFVPQVVDPDGQTLEFALTGKPEWAEFDPTSGRLWGTPDAGDVGLHIGIVISVTDSVVSASLPAFDIEVTGGAAPGPTNQPPTISGSPATSVTEAQAYSFTPSASDPDGQALTFSIVNRPSWATFSTATGRLSGTPAVANAGTYSGIAISVSDGAATASLPSFTLTVSAAAATNRPPVISGSPATSATVGQAYSFTPGASDPDGQALTFSIVNRPSWATFNTTTGRLSGTPAAANAGTYSGIAISVSDGAATASLPSFTLTVSAAAATNRPPVISGSPATSATVGQAYSFTPGASDPDGQALTFSIVNKPSWATFNTATGRLSGTPAAANAGTYSGIAISVSDGAATASLPSFTVTVQQIQLGSATIRWTPPTQNTDNSPLTNLRGYRIYYGTSSGNLSQVLDLPNAGLSSGVVENLSPGTWYFAVTSYNASNVESDRSNVTSKTIG
jgi:hypothetical protein